MCSVFFMPHDYAKRIWLFEGQVALNSCAWSRLWRTLTDGACRHLLILAPIDLGQECGVDFWLDRWSKRVATCRW